MPILRGWPGRGQPYVKPVAERSDFGCHKGKQRVPGLARYANMADGSRIDPRRPGVSIPEVELSGLPACWRAPSSALFTGGPVSRVMGALGAHQYIS